MTESEEVRRFTDRMVAVEEWLMHADRLLAGLNEVVCSLQDRLDEQNRRLEALRILLERRVAPPAEERSFEDERPPHY